MSKRKRTTKRNSTIAKQRILKFAAVVFLVVIAVTLVFGMCEKSGMNGRNEEVRGVWISYGDFKTLGLYNRSEKDFKNNADEFLQIAEEYGINTVYFHVRAFRDAAYDSEFFPTASYLWDRTGPIGYDALELMIQLAHEHDMELHAWLNPYRNTSFEEEILDPAEQSTTDEILLCVREIIDNYDIDGIHFDDYFYDEKNSLPDDEKKKNVNMMIQQVYECVHQDGANLVFGISPAGNISYCESIGADVKAWMSEPGYVDYIIPQIYWTDEHTASWRENMFSDTLDEWISLNKIDTQMYIGLAAYKAGTDDADDPGWKTNDDNIARQVLQLKEKGCNGYVIFSAGDFYKSHAGKELENYRNLVF